MEKTKESLFVLFTVPQQLLGSAACYMAWDGYPTILRSKAARFHSYADAKAFAKENRIALNGLTYIGLEDFTAIKLRGSEAPNHQGRIGGHIMMTMNQAATRQVKWKQRLYRIACEHMILEVESDEKGYLTGNYVCNLCGESVAQGDLAA